MEPGRNLCAQYENEMPPCRTVCLFVFFFVNLNYLVLRNLANRIKTNTKIAEVKENSSASKA